MGKALKTLLLLVLFATSAHGQGILPQIMTGIPSWTLNQSPSNLTCSSGLAGPGTFTCTVNTSAIPAKHTVIVAVAIWLLKASGSNPPQPTHNALTSAGGSETWTRCPSGAQVAQNKATGMWAVLDCDYVLSASGGETSITTSWTTSTYTTGYFNVDVQVVDISASVGSVSLDTQGKNADCGNGVTTCAGPALTLTGPSDYILQWAFNIDTAFASISGAAYTNPYNAESAENNVQGGFAGALNQSSAPAQTWTFSGGATSNAAASAIAFKAK